MAPDMVQAASVAAVASETLRRICDNTLTSLICRDTTNATIHASRTLARLSTKATGDMPLRRILTASEATNAPIR